MIGLGLQTSCTRSNQILDVRLHSLLSKQLLDPGVGNWEPRVATDSTGLQCFKDFQMESLVVTHPNAISNVNDTTDQRIRWMGITVKG